MQIVDHSIILKKKHFGEKHELVTVLTKEHGLFKGLKKGLNIEVGTLVKSTWTARLPDHLGNWRFEVDIMYPAIAINQYSKIQCLLTFCELLCEFLTERTPCSDVFEKAISFLNSLADPKDWILKYLLLELHLLPKAGFVLDFSDIAKATKEDPLMFVSPKTGKVVTQSKGDPYKNKLILLPNFLISKDWERLNFSNITKSELLKAFELTKAFLFSANSLRHSYFNNLLLDARNRMLASSIDLIYM